MSKENTKKRKNKERKRKTIQQRRKVINEKNPLLSYIRGLSELDIRNGISYDLVRRFTPKENREYMKRLAKEANKNLSDILVSGKHSYAVKEYFQNQKNRFFGKNVQNNLQSIQKEISRIRGFMSKKSSTLEGIKEIEKRTEETLQNRYGLRKDENIDWDKFHKIMDKFSELATPSLFNDNYKEILEYTFTESSKKRNKNELIKEIERIVENMYVEQQANDPINQINDEMWEIVQDAIKERERILQYQSMQFD